MRTRSAAVLGLAALLGSAALAAPASARTPTESWIVVLRDGASTPDAAAAVARQLGGQVSHVYRHALRGYAVTLTPAALDAIRTDPAVAYVERDGTMSVDTTQLNPPWGLDRIDQRSRPTNGTFVYTATGTGVKAYVLDTGIRYTHTQFGGRASAGYDAVTAGGGAVDCHGHGTHVAGTIGGSTYGVAKNVTLIGVRVLGCDGSGPTSGVIAGVDWVTGNHAANQPAVANMSLTGSGNNSLDTAVRASIADGVSYSVAAGNDGVDGRACSLSPSRVTEAMTLGASDAVDAAASYSNYGNCVDWYAPGSSVNSAYYTSDTAVATMSGTSMATPHNAGVAAQYLQTHTTDSPATVASVIASKLTQGVVTNAGSTCVLIVFDCVSNANNDLLFTDF